MEKLIKLCISFESAMDTVHKNLKKLNSMLSSKSVPINNTLTYQILSVSLNLTKASVILKELKILATMINDDISNRYTIEFNKLDGSKNINQSDVEEFKKLVEVTYKSDEPEYELCMNICTEINDFRTKITSVNELVKNWINLQSLIYSTNFSIWELNLKRLQSKSISQSEFLNIIDILNYGAENLNKI